MPRLRFLLPLFVVLFWSVAAACWGAPEPGRPDRESIEREGNLLPKGGGQSAEDEKDEEKGDEKEDDEEKPAGLFGEHLHGRGGLSLEYIYTGDAFNNTRGGLSTDRATSYRGDLDLVMNADLEKMGFGPGGKFFLLGQNGHGFGPTRYAGDFQIASNIDAPDFMQVAEYWYERNVRDKFLTVRLGKQDCNAEFAVVDLGGDFVNSSFGLPPTIPMPAFPNPSMGAATFFQLGEHVRFMVGVWDGMPDIGNWGFSDTGVTFTIGEVKLTYSLPGPSALPGDFHAGTWYHSGSWAVLPSNASSDLGRTWPFRTARYFGLGRIGAGGEGTSGGDSRVGNHGVYLGLDQLLFKEKAEEEKDPQGLGLFVQYGWSPEDLNWAHQYVGAGLVYRGLLPSRDTDLLGAGIAHVIFSGELPGSGHESAIELYYKAVLTPWASVQPDLQYIVSPGGTERDSLLAGLRFEVVF